MLRFVITTFCFLITGICGIPEFFQKDNELEENILFDRRDEDYRLLLPKMFEVFEVCEVKCLGKACKCCHRVFNVVPVCGTLYIDPPTNTVEIGFTLTGRRAFTAVFSLTPFLNFSHTAQTMLGDVDLCGNATIFEHITNPDSFRICIEGEVKLNNVKHLHVKLNCMEFNGDIIFESEDNTESGKNIGSVTILNQLTLANLLRKHITGNIFG